MSKFRCEVKREISKINLSKGFIFVIPLLFFFTSCMPDTSSKSKNLKTSALYNGTTTGCKNSYFISTTTNTCIDSCEEYEGFHAGTAEEIASFKKTVSTDKAKFIDKSKGVCIEDVPEIKRPSNAFTINASSCSCINGKADSINDCSAVCASKPSTTTAKLFLSLTPGTEVLLNDKLKNLYNWCTVQIDDGLAKPECVMSAWDGSSEVPLAVNLSANSNNATVDVSQLSYNRTYVIKIVEKYSGATTGEFQLYRKPQSSNNPTVGLLKTTPVSQYTCITYGGEVVGTNFKVTSSLRRFFYYAASETPPPVPPYATNAVHDTVCHDTNLHSGNDSYEYPRLENIPMQFALWAKSDSRLAKTSTSAQENDLAINDLIAERYAEESGTTGSTFKLFSPVKYPNTPKLTNTNQTTLSLGFIMIPFIDKTTNKSMCPKQSDFEGTDTLFNVLGEFITETEALYIGETSGEVIDGATGVIYSQMFITEGQLSPVAFYIENGLKIKADATAMRTRTIHYYWPIISGSDPLLQADRRLFTIKYQTELFGASPGILSTSQPDDKRVGCVPKSL